jgi:carbon-monoxide dehydrogenase medium subunit
MKLAGYHAPQTLDEAITLLAGIAVARPLAGGNTLLVEPSRSRIGDSELVDLRRIVELSGIRARDGGIWIGAMTPLVRIADDPTVQAKFSALAESVRSIGDAQVRNRASLGGNLADQNPEADLPAAVLALAAQIEVRGTSGSRTIAADDLLIGTAQTSLARGELITGVVLPGAASHSGSAYEKIKHPATLYAICGVAASVTLTASGSVSGCRVTVTGATEGGTRLPAVEAALVGRQPDPNALGAALAQEAQSLRFRGDRFASADYRRHLTGVLVQRAITRAVERAVSS